MVILRQEKAGGEGGGGNNVKVAKPCHKQKQKAWQKKETRVNFLIPKSLNVKST